MEWNDDLSVGVELIDTQHKELFKAINDLHMACKSGKGRTEVIKVIDFLGDYCKTHFREEEGLQQKYQWPKYEAHKQLHEKFISDYKDLKKLYEEDGSSLVFLGRVNSLVTQWLIQHIKNVDKELGLYIISKQKELLSHK